MKTDQKNMKNNFAPNPGLLRSLHRVMVFTFHFAFEAMLWKMEVASERLEMSML